MGKIDHKVLAAMKADGKSGKEIAAHFDCSEAYVTQEWKKIKPNLHRYLTAEKSLQVIGDERQLREQMVTAINTIVENKETISKAIKGNAAALRKMDLEDVDSKARHEILLKYMSEFRQLVRNFSDIAYTWDREAYQRDKDTWKQLFSWIFHTILDQNQKMEVRDKMLELNMKGGN